MRELVPCVWGWVPCVKDDLCGRTVDERAAALHGRADALCALHGRAALHKLVPCMRGRAGALRGRVGALCLCHKIRNHYRILCTV